VESVHGQTLLSLAFNYGILSLKTLTFGTDVLPVNVEDRPLGCMIHMDEDEKVITVRRLLMRDFKTKERSGDHTESAVRLRSPFHFSCNDSTPGASKGTPGDAKCATEILGRAGAKIRKMGGAKFKFGHLIRRKKTKIVATRCHISRLKCTKFDFG